MSEEELWYPAFGLKENPFQYYDFNNERDFSELEEFYILTKAVDVITGLVESRMTSGLAGDRGTGKSTVLWLAANNIKKKMEKFPGVKVHVFPSPKGMLEFFNKLFRASLPLKKDPSHRHDYDYEIIDGIVRGQVKMDSWFGYGIRESIVAGRKSKDGVVTHNYCRYPHCKRSSPRCDFALLRREMSGGGVRKINSELLISNLPREEYCPLKLYLTKHFLTYSETLRHVFLIDLPDDLAKIKEFESLVRTMQSVGTVILVGVREHMRKLKKLDLFARYPWREFPLMTNDELEELCHKRVVWQQEGKAPFPFTKKALEFIVKESVRNPRTLIQTCGNILVDAKLEGIVKPISLQFVEKSEFVPCMTFDKAVELLIGKYVDMKRRWVKVEEEAVRDMKEWFNFSVKSRSLGRRFARLKREKGLPLDHRFNPTSEYLFTSDAEE